jgi:MerR family transcriptional regulator, thiopeptide resistance regulator
MKHETISILARRFGLSRSALLYYDRIGLLQPTGRTAAGYRVYGAKDVERLRRICRFREAGLTLDDIALALQARGKPSVRTLENRMEQLSGEISALKSKQRLLASLLRRIRSGRCPATLSKELWVSMLRAAGMSDGAMMRWHGEFEKRAPGEHQQFLESLGIAPKEIATIRRESAEKTKGRGGN